MTTMQEMAHGIFARPPELELIEFRGEWRTVGELHAIDRRVNALVDASGASQLAPIALVPRNDPAILGAMLGLARAGRYVRMIHVYQSPEGIARDILNLGPAVVIALEEDFTPPVLAILHERGIAAVAIAGLKVRPIEGLAQFEGQCAPPAGEPLFDLLTSGTTGPPKRFPITYDFIAREIVTNSTLPMGEGPDPLKLPPAHLYWPFGNFSGLYGTLTPLLQGMRGVLAERFRIEEFHDFLVRFHPTWVGLPPAGIQMTLDAGIPVEDFASVRFVRVGSAPLPPKSHRAFEDRYGIPILNAYGATEFGGPVAVMPLDGYPEWGRQKLGSVGLPYAGAELRIVHGETHEVLPPGTEGLLEVMAPRMGPDWIRTSDLGMIDEDGFIWHRGRADGAIMRGGFKILPETIEAALVLHDSVAAAMATGIEDHRLGQVPAVGVQLLPGARRPTIEELESHLRRHVESTHLPKLWRFIDELPYNSLMKPDRKALRKILETVPADV